MLQISLHVTAYVAAYVTVLVTCYSLYYRFCYLLCYMLQFLLQIVLVVNDLPANRSIDPASATYQLHGTLKLTMRQRWINSVSKPTFLN